MAANTKLINQVQDERSSTRYLADLVTKLVEQSPTTVQVNHYKADMRAWCETLTVKWSMVKGDSGTAVYFLFEDMKTAAMFKMMWIEAEDAR